MNTFIDVLIFISGAIAILSIVAMLVFVWIAAVTGINAILGYIVACLLTAFIFGIPPVISESI